MIVFRIFIFGPMWNYRSHFFAKWFTHFLISSSWFFSEIMANNLSISGSIDFFYTMNWIFLDFQTWQSLISCWFDHDCRHKQLVRGEIWLGEKKIVHAWLAIILDCLHSSFSTMIALVKFMDSDAISMY